MTRVIRFAPPYAAWSVSIQNGWAILWRMADVGMNQAMDSKPLTSTFFTSTAMPPAGQRKDLAVLIHH